MAVVAASGLRRTPLVAFLVIPYAGNSRLISANLADIKLVDAENSCHNLRKKCGEWLYISMNYPIGPIFDGTKAGSQNNWQPSGCDRDA
jgi:hypothetical protein